MTVKHVISRFKMRGLALVVFLATISTGAQGASLCWKSEENPATKVAYASAEEWEYDVHYWSQRRPGIVNPLSLIQAYGVYKSEQKSKANFQNDKELHCYFGCRIAQATDYQTAQYVAWLKEDRDIKDCNLKSHFEIADFEATIHGADFGTSGGTRQACAQNCAEQY